MSTKTSNFCRGFISDRYFLFIHRLKKPKENHSFPINRSDIVINKGFSNLNLGLSFSSNVITSFKLKSLSYPNKLKNASSSSRLTVFDKPSLK